MEIGHIEVAGDRLEVARIAPDRNARPLVFLHEGLGSVAAWRDFPQVLCDALDAPGLVYSRRGYGRSAPLAGPRGADYLHREAQVVLPALLRALDLHAPFLLGHSDGGSIALLAAAQPPGDVAPAAIAVLAPHVFVEEVTLLGVRAARLAWEAGASGRLQPRLARWHDDPAGAFFGWNDAWLAPTFRDWNIEAELDQVRCPVLAIQGVDDRYGTLAQLDRIARAVRGPCRLLRLAGCGHAPHDEAPQVVIEAVAALYGEHADRSAVCDV